MNSDKTELVVYLEFRPASPNEYKDYKKFLDPDKPPSVGFQTCYTVDILRANLFITPAERNLGARQLRTDSSRQRRSSSNPLRVHMAVIIPWTKR